MTDPRRPDFEPRPLRPLLDEAPGAEPPAWLDANVRAAAAQAAEFARQRGPGTTGENTPDRAGAPSSDERKPARLGWMPVGATVAVVVLGMMLVISRPLDRKADSPQAESAGMREEGARQKNLDKAPLRADAPTRERDAAVANEDRQPREAKREPSGALGAAAPAAPAAAGPAPATPAAPAAAAAVESEVVAPRTPQACTERIGQLRRFDRIDDARRLLRACRSRFPEHSFPAEMVRALGD